MWLTQLPDLFTTTDFSAADLVLINLQSRFKFFFLHVDPVEPRISVSAGKLKQKSPTPIAVIGDKRLLLYMCFSA